MATTDNWVKLCRWWQEHFKSRFNPSCSPPSSSNINSDLNARVSSFLQRRSSLMSFRHSNNIPSTNAKKRASFGGIEDHHPIGSIDDSSAFRYVYDNTFNSNSKSSTSTSNTKRSVHEKLTILDRFPKDSLLR